MRNVLVTGATRGLGLAIADRLAHQGYRVIASGRIDSEGLKQLRLRKPDVVHYAAFDLSEVDHIREFIHGLTAAHGQLYGLVNNAAIGLDGVLGTMHNTDIERMIRVNTLAPIVLTKYAARSMMLGREGRIVNISSIIASTGFSGLSAYAATKASLEGFTRSLARELGRLKITVNAVAPGFMQTDMTSTLNDDKLKSILRRSPLQALARPEDAAGAVAYLLGPDGALVTGTIMTVDAGSTC